MNDILEFIDDVKELEALYQSGDLRELDFRLLIQKYESQVEQFEHDMQEQQELFFRGTPFKLV